MATVRAWGVVTAYSSSSLVIAPSEARAIECHLRLKDGVRKKADLALSVLTGRATPLTAWTLVFEDGREQAFFAAGPGLASAFAAKMAAPVRLTETDPLEALLGLDDAELLDQCRHVWSRGQIAARLPAVKQRINNPSRFKGPMTHSNRLLICYALRLAFDHAHLGCTVPSMLDGPPPKAERDRVFERHIHSIPAAVIRDVWYNNPSSFLVMCDARFIRAVMNFVSAYGEDPETITAGEAAALWQGGPEALVSARLDVRGRRGNTLAAWLKRTQPSSTRSKRSSAERGTRP